MKNKLLFTSISPEGIRQSKEDIKQIQTFAEVSAQKAQLNHFSEQLLKSAQNISKGDLDHMHDDLYSCLKLIVRFLDFLDG